MASCCTGLTEQFDERHARRDLRRYRRRGVRRSTRALLDALLGEGVEGATLLDIGGGIGAIQHALLESGAAETTDVDVSRAYIASAREEGARRKTLNRMRFHTGDFVELASSLGAADIVTLDRVICCYPDAARLVGASTHKAARLYGLVFPRSGGAMRLAAAMANALLALRGSSFRIHIHDTATIDGLVRSAGFEPSARSNTVLWQVFLYRRAAPL